MEIDRSTLGKYCSIYQDTIRWQMSCGVASVADLPGIGSHYTRSEKRSFRCVSGTGPCAPDYVISVFGVIGRSPSRLSYLLACFISQCVFPLISLLLSHVLSSHLRTWKGSHSRRLPRPRPRLHWRRRLDLLSLLYCYNSREHKSHRRQITTVHQRHLVIYLVYL